LIAAWSAGLLSTLLVVGYTVASVLAYLFLPLPAGKPANPALLLATATAYILAHEAIHAATAKLFNPRTTIKLYPRLLALIVNYSSLKFSEYCVVLLAPQLLLGIPTVVALAVAPSWLLYTTLLVHLVASSGDYASLTLTLIARIKLRESIARVHLLYDEKGRVAGGVYETRSGKLLAVLLE